MKPETYKRQEATVSPEMQVAMERLRTSLAQRHGEQALPAIDSAVSAMAPLMLASGLGYRETLSALNVKIVNQLHSSIRPQR
ncbi:MAG: hypothetical protein P4M11_10770 [Candidatus Pacebacteria bacterium]|nr:hypothetical protein [Candidatus Paceibacterota bacterium]